MGWSGDILQARDRAAEADNGVTVEYIIPKEGALMWFDNMAIPVRCAEPEEAHEFLNYIMKPGTWRRPRTTSTTPTATSPRRNSSKRT
jgi:putrescine transport system substrate-binding protein